MPRLHATHGPKAAIRDQHGAQVLLRGVNVNQLGEYFQADPSLPPTVPLTRTTSTTSPSSASTRPAHRQLVAARAEPGRVRHGVRRPDPARGPVGGGLRPLHRARHAPGRRTASRSSTPRGRDLPGRHQARRTAGTARPPGRRSPTAPRPAGPASASSSPAVTHAWQHFYDNTDGIQTDLVDTWGRLAHDFATTRNVAGFDLLNEPGFGLDAAPTTTDLGAFYGRAIERDPQRARPPAAASTHIVFWRAERRLVGVGSDAVPTPGFTTDKNIVFSPHVYAESLSPHCRSRTASPAPRQGGQGSTASPLWIGEWGYWLRRPGRRLAPDGPVRCRRGRRTVRRRLVGLEAGLRRPARREPARRPAGADLAQPEPVHLPRRGEVGAGPGVAEVLSRPVARAVPGTITPAHSDGRTGTLVLRARDAERLARRCALRVSCPKRCAEQAGAGHRHRPGPALASSTATWCCAAASQEQVRAADRLTPGTDAS